MDVERSRKIELYGDAYRILTEALARFPREMWHFKSAPGDWSVHEVVVHITDSEANSYVRCRRLIAEPGKDVIAYDENGWMQALRYSEQSTDDALELFRWLRLTSYKLIKSLPESTWANTIEHPENGTMSLDDWLDVYANHIPDHVEQMQRVYELWMHIGLEPEGR
ncbi:MAG TPA: DinB family protein [Chloroflexia bacterium]|nr:DinB family protein [Chloroflexia bacterium]